MDVVYSCPNFPEAQTSKISNFIWLKCTWFISLSCGINLLFQNEAES